LPRQCGQPGINAQPGQSVSHLALPIRNKPLWNLYDSYIDVASRASTEERREFLRMPYDCPSRKADAMTAKNISRFGRNTREALALRRLKLAGADVVF
jgi:DNA invertase Pin-like site-specific DNA recombinase